MSEKGRQHRKGTPSGSSPEDAVAFDDIFPEIDADDPRRRVADETPQPDARAIRREREAARELRDSPWWKNQLAKGVCHYCGKRFAPAELTMDHIVPVSRGGHSVKGNVVPCCKQCNNRKKYFLPMEMQTMSPSLQEQIYGLVVAASTRLPEDIRQALETAATAEDEGSPARQTLDTINRNAVLALDNRLPLCQDTGLVNFYISAPDGTLHLPIEEAARAAVVQATSEGLLRQNCVEVPSGRNTGNNLGNGNPAFHWDIAEEGAPVRMTLLLKGGGSENVGVQYSLPDSRLNAGRDLEGIRRCVLDAAFQAQGKGCAPGVFGVAVGGDRLGGYEEAKRQLLRRIGERSADAALAALEERLLTEINGLGVGPMGLGGRTTALDVFIGCRNRHPASYFVTVCYNCWCCRRQTIVLNNVL